jgi:pilus assembly protein CpaB
LSRITPGTIIVGIFAILFGLVGAYAVQRYLAPPAAPVAAPPAERIRLPQASIDLAPGRPLTLGDIAIVSYTPQQLKKIDLPDQYMVNPQQIIGRILREPVTKGAAFTTASFYPEGTGPSVAERLEPGLRAVTVPIQGTGLLNGLASAGARVDVLFRTFENQEKNVPATTVTLLEDVEILAVGRNVVPGAQMSGDVSAVTLAVTPEQANALKIVEGQGDFSLALRGGDDDSFTAGSGPQTLHSLLKLPPKQEPHKLEIWRGRSLQTVTFEGDKIVEQTTIDMPVAPSRKRDRRAAAAIQATPDATGTVAAQETVEIVP